MPTGQQQVRARVAIAEELMVYFVGPAPARCPTLAQLAGLPLHPPPSLSVRQKHEVWCPSFSFPASFVLHINCLMEFLCADPFLLLCFLLFQQLYQEGQ
jgi:hypothetical protein